MACQPGLNLTKIHRPAISDLARPSLAKAYDGAAFDDNSHTDIEGPQSWSDVQAAFQQLQRGHDELRCMIQRPV